MEPETEKLKDLVVYLIEKIKYQENMISYFEKKSDSFEKLILEKGIGKAKEAERKGEGK